MASFSSCPLDSRMRPSIEHVEAGGVGRQHAHLAPLPSGFQRIAQHDGHVARLGLAHVRVDALLSPAPSRPREYSGRTGARRRRAIHAREFRPSPFLQPRERWDAGPAPCSRQAPRSVTAADRTARQRTLRAQTLTSRMAHDVLCLYFRYSSQSRSRSSGSVSFMAASRNCRATMSSSRPSGISPGTALPGPSRPWRRHRLRCRR